MRNIFALLACGFTLALGQSYAQGQADPQLVALAVNAPDKLAWTLYLQVTADRKTAGNNNALFETWASDKDTFNLNPTWPTQPRALALRQRALAAAQQEFVAKFRSGEARPLPLALPPAPGQNESEETRRNPAAFNFIVQNGLFKVSGLRARFGAELSFPPGAIEVKANWYPIDKIPGFSGTADEARRLYHTNTADNQTFALVALHIISKLVPNWTWATFEHKNNPGRCDLIGCKDAFGASTAYVPPNERQNEGYPDCAKTPALDAMMPKTAWDSTFANYCLKARSPISPILPGDLRALAIP